jgi:hypothetical protein
MLRDCRFEIADFSFAPVLRELRGSAYAKASADRAGRKVKG